MKLVNLKDVMRAKNVKSIEVAAELNVAEKTVSEWLNGKTFPNDTSLLYLLCKFGPLKAESDAGAIIDLTPVNPPKPPISHEATATAGEGAEQKAV